ncbi:inositol phosphate phosphatase SopB [Endozoicomonas numazuensis]|uniref:Uncharacterized protein n=1 Tax=Endozoicomonas numazuensis TaxID=1137799 RepID=A0A081NE06_9GAMM|nr:inositol phosphate phosphatase SopB [Endozoicomonas numazuensis]KEQ16679.1 hypothetical protein GZ78_18410 [Endozoicomonas numazuensis]
MQPGASPVSPEQLSLQSVVDYCNSCTLGGKYIGKDPSGQLVSIGNFFGWSVSIPKETKDFLREFETTASRYHQINSLLNPVKAIDQRRVHVLAPADRCTVNRTMDISKGLLNSQAGKLHEAETALVNYLANKNSADGTKETTKMVSHLWTTVLQADFKPESRDAYLRQLRTRLSSAQKFNGLDSVAEYALAMSHLESHYHQLMIGNAHEEFSKAGVELTREQIQQLPKAPVGFYKSDLTRAEIALTSYISEKDNPDLDQSKLDELTAEFSKQLEAAKFDGQERTEYLTHVRAIFSDASKANFNNSLVDYLHVTTKLRDIHHGPEAQIYERPRTPTLSPTASPTFEFPDPLEDVSVEATLTSLSTLKPRELPSEETLKLLDPRDLDTLRKSHMEVEQRLSIIEVEDEEFEAVVMGEDFPLEEASLKSSLPTPDKPVEDDPEWGDFVSGSVSTVPTTTPPPLSSSDSEPELGAVNVEKSSYLNSVITALIPGHVERDIETASTDTDAGYDDFLEDMNWSDWQELDETDRQDFHRLRANTITDTEQLRPARVMELDVTQAPLPQDVKIASPLTPEQKHQARTHWNDLFSELYGFDMNTLPAHEQRELDIALYHASVKDGQPATKEELKSALREHKSLSEHYLPGSVAALRTFLKDYFPTAQLEEQLDAIQEKLNLDYEQMSRLKYVVGFMTKQVVPALCESPFDAQRNPVEQLERVEELLNHLDDPLEGLITQMQEGVIGQLDHPASELVIALSLQDITKVKDSLNQKKAALEMLIENDFSHDKNLQQGNVRLYRAALHAAEEKLKHTEEKLAKTSRFNLIKRHTRGQKVTALKTLKASLERRLKEEEERQVEPVLVKNIVGQLHKTKKVLTKQLEAARIDKGSFTHSLEHTLNHNPWQPIHKEYVMAHNGVYYSYKIDTTPSGAVSWSLEPDEEGHYLKLDGSRKDVFDLEHGGRSSMSPKEKEHTINSWIVRMTDDAGRPVIHKIRTGVPVSFPMFAAQAAEQDIFNVTVTRMRETLGLMVLEAMGDKPEFKDAVENGTPIDFTAVHTSLLSPDRVRATANEKAKALSPKLQKLVASKLDDEMVMHRFIQMAIDELSNNGPTAIEFTDSAGEKQAVKVNYTGVLFSCPVNKMGQKDFYKVWEQADPINEKASLDMFGGMDPSQPIGGRVGEFLRTTDKSEAFKNLMIHCTRQVQYILHNKLHHEDQDMALLLAGLLNIIGQHAADGYHDFCKSGKDRTGYVNQFCIELAALIDTLGNGEVPPMDLPTSIFKRFSAQSALVSTGQLEIIGQCLGELGAKIDQGPARHGNNYHRVHFDSKVSAPLVGTIDA